MSVDQTTIAGVAAFATGGVLFLLHLKRAGAERAVRQRQAVAAIRTGKLPAVAAPAELKVAGQEIVHISAKCAQVHRVDAKQELGEGLFVATSRRVCFFGKSKVTLTWKKIDAVAMALDGTVNVRAGDGRAFAFVLRRGQDLQLAGEILSVLDINRARAAAKAAANARARAETAARVAAEKAVQAEPAAEMAEEKAEP